MLSIETDLGLAQIVEDISELPDLSGASRMFLDVETTGFSDDREAFNPYQGDRICGIAVTVDNHPHAWYVPFRHRDKDWNLPLDNVQRWIKTLPASSEWINHNVKFDAHFMRHDGYEHQGRMVDTVVLAKMIDSDRMGHALKPLCREWLGLDMDEATRVDSYLNGLKKGNKKCKDFGAVPADILGEYACMDTLGNRELYRYLCQRKESGFADVWETEILLTPVLYDMECTGMRGDVLAIKREAVTVITRILEIHEEIANITGIEFTDSNVHLFDILCVQMGLPPIAFNEEGNASFDKNALAGYTIHPAVLADEKLKRLIDLIIECRRESTFNGLFLQTYLELMDDDGFLHPSFNQLVRTGRMSCRRPNAQQLNKRAKRLMIPPEGYGILRADASQIEFRLIAHYLNDEETLRAYRENPDTDFHQWVADSAHTNRAAGKTLNFAMGYGAGKKKVTASLSSNPDIMLEVGETVAQLVASGKIDPSAQESEFRRLCGERAEEVYYGYHERFPQLKKVTNLAARRARLRGYVFNVFGRRRHLPARAAHKAFNTVVQGGAMDFIKTRAVALAPRYNREMRELGILPFVNVHDELAWYVPLEVGPDPAVCKMIDTELCHQPVPLRLPFTWDMGWSSRHWAEASADEATVDSNGQWIGGPLSLASV